MNNKKLGSAYKQQIQYLKAVLKDKTFGLEKLFRLLLCLIQFIYPILLVREIFGYFGRRQRKLAVESYFFLKLLFPVFIFMLGWQSYHIVIFFIIYLLSETIFHILSIIFLSDIHTAPLSYRRSILLLLLNYIEVVLDFSIIYSGLNLLNKTLSPIEAVYFSFVTQTTLGFGDYYPKCYVGQTIVVFQLIIL